MRTKDEQHKARLKHDFSQSVLRRIFDNESAFRAFLRTRLGDETLVEDLFQQCLLRAVEHQHSVNNEESVVAWFYRILRNVVIDYYRSKAAQGSHRRGFEKEAGVLYQQEVPSLDDVKPAICECLDDVVKTLRPGYSEVIRRIDLGGESIADVANALQISPANATVRLHRARQALRESLEQACGICTKHGCLNCTCA